MKITLKEYAERHGKELVLLRQKYYRGGFKTCEKIGRDLFIDEDEPLIDERVKSGKYIGFRNNIRKDKTNEEI